MSVRAFEPHYRRIISDIRDRITSGQWPAGSRLPSTRQLAEMYGDLYGVRSQSTVRQAITILIETGELSGHQGLGVFVAHPNGHHEQRD
jgi:GntR family transcriptional regulator